jgi:hypothetical protein
MNEFGGGGGACAANPAYGVNHSGRTVPIVAAMGDIVDCEISPPS